MKKDLQGIKVLFIDSVHKDLQEGLEANGAVCDIKYEVSKEEISSCIHQYKGIVIRSRFKLDRDFLSKANNLKFIARSGAGMENIDIDYCNEYGIECFNAPEGNRNAVAEHILGMLLSLFNKLIPAHQEVQQGIWKREENRGVELDGKTIGIIGFGNNGSAFAKKLQGFDVEILAYDKFKTNYGTNQVKESNWEEIQDKVDVLSLHVPLTEETNHLINTELIQKFKKPFYLINAARGKNVSTSDLVSALKERKILGACLDVLEYEKNSFEKLERDALPQDFRYLANAKNVVLSPHVAGWTLESFEKLSEVLLKKIRAIYNCS